MRDSTILRLSAKLLKVAASEFGNHGCNDMNLDDYGLSRVEQEELVTAMHQNNGDPEEIPRSIFALPYTSDFCIMYICARLLKELSYAS